MAGAIFSGFAMVVTLLVPARRLYRVEHLVTERHLDNIGKMILAMCWIIVYAYVFETWAAARSGDVFERDVHLHARPFGPFAPLFWTTIVGNCLVPQALWLRRVRTSPVALFAISIAIQIGMWTERFLIVVTSQSRDFLPSSWRGYSPTLVDLSLLGGTLSFFLFLFLLFLRYVPFIPIAENKHAR